MKSAAEYPEYQGDPDNIQFLTRDEHLEAHKGSWQNPTNWYYNPETKEFVDFGENKPIPCAPINLSKLVCSPVSESQKRSDELKETATERKVPTERTRPSCQEEKSQRSEKKPQSKTTVAPPKVHESFGDKFLHVVDAVKEFSEKYPVLNGIVKRGGAAVVTAAVANNSSRGGRHNDD